MNKKINRINKEYENTLKIALLFCYKKHLEIKNVLDDVKKKMAAE